MELSLQTGAVAGRTVLRVGGEIDVYTAPRLRERLLELITAGERRIVVDLQGVEFLDSTGLGVLVGVQRLVSAQDGQLGLVCTQERILKVFRITGLDQFFDMHPSAESAAGLTDSPESQGGNSSPAESGASGNANPSTPESPEAAPPSDDDSASGGSPQAPSR